MARLAGHGEVAAAFTADELRALPAPGGPPDEWSLAQRYRAGFDPERSPDILFALKPRITPIAQPRAGAVATHGSPWIYDRRVPILFWWPDADGFEQPLAIETVDIAPTLASLIALAIPAGEIDGRCRDLDATAVDSCAAR
jgi:alkaline phosphatase